MHSYTYFTPILLRMQTVLAASAPLPLRSALGLPPVHILTRTENTEL